MPNQEEITEIITEDVEAAKSTFIDDIREFSTSFITESQSVISQHERFSNSDNEIE